MVDSDVTIDSRVTVSGNVHLILADGCNLTVNGGIQVQDNGTEQTSNTNALTIYAQSAGNSMGSLTAQNAADQNAGEGAGISGGFGHRYGLCADGSFNTNKDGEAGNAVIFAGSTSGVAISDNSDAKKASWSGVVFEDNSGKVYGTSVAPSEDFTIESGKTLTIEATQTLTIPEGVTMTVNGTLTNNGALYVDGTLSGTAGGNE